MIYSIVHMNPFKVYEAMFEGNFGTNRRMWVTFRDMAMLLCIGIGLAPGVQNAFLEHWGGGADT